jgi:hypothetical protein
MESKEQSGQLTEEQKQDLKGKKKNKCMEVCCSPKMQRRWGVAAVLITIFHVSINRYIGAIGMNLVLGSGSMFEYTMIQSGILMRIFEDQDQTQVSSKLYRKLVARLCNKHITVAMFFAYHISVLTMDEIYCGLVLVGMFVSVIYIKIYAFNSFFKEYTSLIDEFKRNPKRT